MNVIPAIDLHEGRCVRLLKGDFAHTTVYSSDPGAVAEAWAALAVADLHVVDLDGARSGEQRNADTVRKIAQSSTLNVQLGGGIRDEHAINSWLARGVNRCVVGSIAATDPQRIIHWLSEFGPERIVVALDVRRNRDGDYRLAAHGWQDTLPISLWDRLSELQDAGLRHLLCTDIDRDGAMGGPNIDLYVEILRRFPALELQASGGVRNLADLVALRDRGIPAAVTGRALLDGRIQPEEIATFRHDA